MANKSDFAAAQKYAKNRLVTAFVSGRPQGQELEPKNYLRSFIAGIAICALLIVGSLIFGIIKPGLQQGWENNKLVVTDTGSRYVSKESVLYSVANLTSARLLIPSADWSVISASDDELVGIARGEEIGIQGAPDYLPGSSNLVKTDVNSCLISNEAITSVGEKTSIPVENNNGVIFNVNRKDYLVVDNIRYALPTTESAEADVLAKLKLNKENVQKATVGWLNLFTAGDLDEYLQTAAKGNVSIDEENIGSRQAFCANVVDGSAKLTVSDNYVPEHLIQAGKGVLFREDGAQLFYLDDRLIAYPVLNDTEEIIKQLGWKPEDILNAPRFFSDLFVVGPELSANNAMHTEKVTSSSSSEKATTVQDVNEQSNTSHDADTPKQCDADEHVKNVPLYAQQMQYFELHKLTKGEGVTVAVVDSGVDKSNPHLQGAVLPGIDLVSTNGQADGTTDELGHGTAVASLIAGREVDGSALVGVAPAAMILPVRVYISDDEPQRQQQTGPDPERMAQGIRWAVDHKADIINISMSANTELPVLKAAVDYAQQRDVLVIASSGNRNTTQDSADSERYPGSYASVIGVAAVDEALHSTDASIHNMGVDIAAPGQDIAAAQKRGVDCTYSPDTASSSFSTALISGTAALVKSYLPNISNDEVRYRLETSSSRPNPDARDNEIGWGVVRPLSALGMIVDNGNRGPHYASLVSYKPTSVVPEQYKSVIISQSDDTLENFAKMTFLGALFLLILLGIVWKARQPEEVSDGN